MSTPGPHTANPSPAATALPSRGTYTPDMPSVGTSGDVGTTGGGDTTAGGGGTSAAGASTPGVARGGTSAPRASTSRGGAPTPDSTGGPTPEASAGGVAVGVRVPPCAPLDQVAAEIARAERYGFDVAWVADSQLLWRDAYAALAVAATRTERITLATAVTNVATRHPTVVASGVNTVAELAPGRVVLGLGTGDSSVKPIGVPPTRRGELRDAIETMRTLLAGGEERIGDRRVRLKDARGEVPVHIAASGPRTLELAGAVADGVVTLAGVSAETIRRTAHAVHTGVRKTGRARADVAFTVGAFCKLTDDVERDAAALKPICLHMATIGAHDFLAIAGIELDAPPHVPEVYPDMVHAEDWSLAVEHASRWVTDEMAVRFAETFCLFGSVDEILERMRRATELGATGFYLRHVGNYTLPSELIESFGGDVLPALRGPR